MHLFERAEARAAVVTSAVLDAAVGRLLWAPASAAGFEGAWWPRSGDAARELRDLVPAVSEHVGGAITRVSLNMDAWSGDHPRRLRLADRIVRVGWFHSIDPAIVTLGRGTFDRVTLLLVPFDLSESAGGDVMARLASLPSWPTTAAAALAGAVAPAPAS